MRSEVVKAVFAGLVLCAFILWRAGSGDLPASLVVPFILAFGVALPLLVLLVSSGRRR